MSITRPAHHEFFKSHLLWFNLPKFQFTKFALVSVPNQNIAQRVFRTWTPWHTPRLFAVAKSICAYTLQRWHWEWSRKSCALNINANQKKLTKSSGIWNLDAFDSICVRFKAPIEHTDQLAHVVVLNLPQVNIRGHIWDDIVRFQACLRNCHASGTNSCTTVLPVSQQVPTSDQLVCSSSKSFSTLGPCPLPDNAVS